MFTVYFWDAHANGMTAYINKKPFSSHSEAKAFSESVNGLLTFNR